MPKPPFPFPSANDDDPIYREGWTVFTPHGSAVPSKPPGTDGIVTGMDYADRWPDELRVIFEHGPFTREEVKSLDEQQLADYFYVTSWILRQEGEAVFKAERETMRGMFLRRLQRGERLKPAE